MYSTQVANSTHATHTTHARQGNHVKHPTQALVWKCIQSIVILIKVYSNNGNSIKLNDTISKWFNSFKNKQNVIICIENEKLFGGANERVTKFTDRPHYPSAASLDIAPNKICINFVSKNNESEADLMVSFPEWNASKIPNLKTVIGVLLLKKKVNSFQKRIFIEIGLLLAVSVSV